MKTNKASSKYEAECASIELEDKENYANKAKTSSREEKKKTKTDAENVSVLGLVSSLSKLINQR